MSACYADIINVQCWRCSKEFSVEVWMLVHKEERPDLYRGVMSGELNETVCSHCGSVFVLEIPVLVIEPDIYPPITFYPGINPKSVSVEEEAAWLLDRLRRKMGEHWRNDWLSQGIRFSSVPLSNHANTSALDVEAISEVSPSEIEVRLNQALEDDDWSAQVEISRLSLNKFGEQLTDRALAHVHNICADALFNDESRDLRTRIEDAINHYKEALKIYSPQEYPEEWADCMTNLSVAYGRRIDGRPEENIDVSIQLLERTREIYTRESHPRKWAIGEMNLGSSYGHRLVGDRATNEEAELSHYCAAETVVRFDTQPEMWVTLQLNIAVNYIDRIGGERATNIEEAIRRSEAVLKVVSHKDIPSMWWVRAKDRLGTAYMDRVEGNHAENIETAIVCLSEALDAAVSEESVAGILNRIGLAYRRRARGNWAKNTETAIKYFQQSLEINTLEKNPVEWAHVTSNLALAYAERVEGNEKDNLEDAIHAHESVFCVCTKEKAPFDWARVHSNLAIACGRRKTGQRENNAWAAIEHCKQSLTVYTLDTYPARHRETQANLAELYMELDLWEEAHEAFEAAIRAGETLLYTAFTPSGRTAEAGTTSRIYPHDAYCLARMGREAESLLRLEQGKTRLMAEQLSLATVDMNRVSEQEKTRFEELREKVRMLEAELRLDPATPARSDDPTLIEEIRKARSKLHEKIASIRARNPDFMPEGLDLAALLSLVPRGGAIVAPFVSKRGSAVLIVLDGCHEITSKEIIWLDDFTEVDLESLVLGASGWARLGGWLEAYRRQGDDPAAWRREIQHVTGELWLRLWEPVHMELRKRGLTVGAPLVIMAQGLLAVLPLHAAWRESEGRKRYLLDEYTVSYTPSGFVLRESQRLACEIGRQQISLLAVTNPTKDLAFASLEGSIIGGHFEESKRALLIEGEATMANTLEMMHGRSYLHFASHARFGWENTLRSGLLLAGDEVLSLAKVLSEFDLRSARLVCLSACETGLHDAWKSPGEYVGLPGGFMQAGAPAVISSLWPVTDLSTLLLMDHFYVSHLERQLPLATALRQAQLWLRDLTNAEIADLLNGYLNRLQIADADVRRLVSINYRKHAMDDPDERPFLNPYYWAPFLLSGH